MSDDPTSACPCGSGKDQEACCLPVINGTPAETAEATMRARYTAFTRGDVDFILSSHHSETRDEVDRDEIERWSTSSEWLGLTIEDTEDGGASDDEGTVTFVARYRIDGHVHNHRERAYFTRDESAWAFHSVLSEVDEPELIPVQPAATVGRNDPCTCGSGKKYKKCCGAAA
jgi:SEC-C motif domain protein